MKKMDCVEIVVDKEKYIKNGVHKGMQGWICSDDCYDYFNSCLRAAQYVQTIYSTFP